MKNKAGFTVIELLIVLLLIGILVFMTLSISNSVRANSQIAGVINTFLADFSRVKLLAASKNRYVSIRFSAGSTFYSIWEQTDVSDFTAWTLVENVNPLHPAIDINFYNPADISNFAVNATGEVRKLEADNSVDTGRNPESVSLIFHILDNSGKVAYQRTIQILPYGGIKVEKK